VLISKHRAQQDRMIGRAMDSRIRHSKHSKFDSGFFRCTIHSFMRNNDGVSAVEFALLAPMLIFALLATVDLGLAISERMTIGHVLRAGAQSATQDAGVAAVARVLRTTAEKNLTVAPAEVSGDDTALALDVGRICSCAAQPAIAVVCSTTCAGDAPTQIFYALTARKTYSGMILPQFSQSKALQVQVR